MAKADLQNCKKALTSNVVWLQQRHTKKICRICVRPGAPLVDVETVDFDMVRLNDSISSEICEKCLNKLRVSYHFLDMCKKSTNILYGYVEKLQDSKNSQFDNCNLHVALEKLPEGELVDDEHTDVNRNIVDLFRKVSDVSNKISRRNSNLKRKQRITKGQRSYLLQQLLKTPKKDGRKSTSKMGHYHRSALRDILDFTINYKFSCEIGKQENRVQQRRNKSPLDNLVDFSENYFRRDFSEFKNHILCVIENQRFNEHRLSFSLDDDYGTQSESEQELEFENVVVEPDIEIKCEKSDYDYEGNNLFYSKQNKFGNLSLRHEISNWDFCVLSDSHRQCLLNCLETSFEEEDVIVKVEDPESAKCGQSLVIKKSGSALNESQVLDKKDLHGTSLANFQSSICRSPSSAVLLLDRTRNHPYINPMLKNQFLFRNFNCERCNKSFKSQGYLNAHVSKVH
ncbi:hypothetical protein D910_10454 [Dendroctonus ponderosae]|uniref:C2H2-type domain-containing protein n=1 Tax=Dendroctonus ponderosae TaxID=77166 RepID=U4UJ86_DENPD|nr:hypothetical protein D910_10454 [Dendroctonus ponderosae]